MAIKFTEEQACRVVAKALRDLADKIERGELIPTEMGTEREMTQISEDDGWTMRSEPTPYWVARVRMRHSDRVADVQD